MNVYEATQIRMRRILTIADNIQIGLSGGKDSLATLYCAIPIARELGMKIRVLFIDEEMVSQATLDLVEKVKQIDVVDFHHMAAPMMDRNGTSKKYPFWFPWNPAEEHIWCRPKPEGVIESFNGHIFDYDKNYSHPDGLPYKAGAVKSAMTMQQLSKTYSDSLQAVTGDFYMALVGLRSAESMARRQTLSSRENIQDKYIFHDLAYPIFDWKAQDTFRLFKKLKAEGADYYCGYNQEYDFMQKTKIKGQYEKQRVGPPLAEEALRGLDLYAEYFPTLWAKMIHRAEGVQGAVRYANTTLFGVRKMTLPKGVKSWQQYLPIAVRQLSAELQKPTASNINKGMSGHKNKTNEPIPELEGHPISGVSWKGLCKMALRGSFRDRVRRSLLNNGQRTRDKLGITLEQAVQRYGSEKYKKAYFKSATFKRRVEKARGADAK